MVLNKLIIQDFKFQISVCNVFEAETFLNKSSNQVLFFFKAATNSSSSKISEGRKKWQTKSCRRCQKISVNDLTLKSEF